MRSSLLHFNSNSDLIWNWLNSQIQHLIARESHLQFRQQIGLVYTRSYNRKKVINLSSKTLHHSLSQRNFSGRQRFLNLGRDSFRRNQFHLQSQALGQPQFNMMLSQYTLLSKRQRKQFYTGGYDSNSSTSVPYCRPTSLSVLYVNSENICILISNIQQKLNGLLVMFP